MRPHFFPKRPHSCTSPFPKEGNTSEKPKTGGFEFQDWPVYRRAIELVRASPMPSDFVALDACRLRDE